MKVIYSTLAGLLLLALVALVVMGGLLWARLPDMLSSALSERLHVPVSIHSLNLGWNTLGIQSLQVGNPPQSILAHALTCQTIALHAPLTEYLNSDVVIEELE